jgi:hypothetical protein
MYSVKRKTNKRKTTRKNNAKNYSVNVINKKMSSETEFGGYPLDLLFGILYLKRKHPTSITLPFDIKELLIKYSEDLRDRSPFTFIGCVIYKCRDNIIYSSKSEKQKFKKKNFTIEFPGKLSDKEFAQLILAAKKSGKRFTIIPLIFRWSCSYTFTGHANILIFDFVNNVVERFEPYGYVATFSQDEMMVSDGFNLKFKSFIKNLGIGLKYHDQNDLLKKGPQHIEEGQLKQPKGKVLEKDSDPEGFCGAWSLWYADLRISNPEKTSFELINKALYVIQQAKQQKLREFIRNYSKYLVKERYKFLKKIKQKNPYNYHMKEQLLSLEQKKTSINKLLKTTKILENK